MCKLKPKLRRLNKVTGRIFGVVVVIKQMKMISSALTLIFKAFVFIINTIRLVYHLASATSLGFVFILGIAVFLLSRYFRLKQPILTQNLIDAIGRGNQHTDRQCSTGQHNYRDNSSDTIAWLPIANRAACLDNVENSRSAIENVSNTPMNGKIFNIRFYGKG